MGNMINSVTNDHNNDKYYFPISSFLRDHKKKPDTTMMNETESKKQTVSYFVSSKR